MTADEIRKLRNEHTPTETVVQIEIAAQLAELNDVMTQFQFDENGRLKIGSKAILYN